MQDRAPTKPNRYAVYDDAHNFLRYEYHERADEPTQVGDALNKANLLPDAVATALGLTGNVQVKDALAKLSGAVFKSQIGGATDVEGNPISGVAYVIRSFADANNVASVSLDVADIHWGDYDSICLEFNAVMSVTGALNVLLDNQSTLGKYKAASANLANLASLYVRDSSYDATKFKLYLDVLDLRDLRGYAQVACTKGVSFSSRSDVGYTEIETDSLSISGCTYGDWCNLDTINFVATSGTVNVNNIRIKGVRL